MNTSNLDDMLENKSFIHYSCGIDADPADGFGYCTCGVVEELAEIKQAIQQLLDEAYKKGYIDGGISEITK